MTLKSMTGFASASGNAGGTEWAWELRSVNGRGLDLRCRVPEGMEAVEGQLRTTVQGVLRRGSVSATLRLTEGQRNGAPLDPEAVRGVLAARAEIEAEASALHVALTPPSAAEVMAEARGVRGGNRQPAALIEAVTAAIPALVEALDAARAAEGEAMGAVLSQQLEAVTSLAAQARATAEARAAVVGQLLRERVAALVGAGASLDEGRLAQELALIAVKADVTEELDRLEAHVAAARGHLGSSEPVGRKLDFLMQEFNREGNTLCAKAGSAELTAIGLDLKVIVDQMREQVQNLE